jgi:tetratricopeptide (TPR) repeat protein
MDNPVNNLKSIIDQMASVLQKPEGHSPRELASAHFRIACAYSEREEYDGLASHLRRAVEHYESAARLFQHEAGDPEAAKERVKAINGLADAYRRLGKFEQARNVSR